MSPNAIRVDSFQNHDRPTTRRIELQGFFKSRHEQERRIRGEFAQVDIPQVTPFTLHGPVDLVLAASIASLEKRLLGGRQLIPEGRIAVMHGTRTAQFQPIGSDTDAVGFEVPASAVSAKGAQLLDLLQINRRETDDPATVTNRPAGGKQSLLYDNPRECRQRRMIGLGTPQYQGVLIGLDTLVWPGATGMSRAVNQIACCIKILDRAHTSGMTGIQQGVRMRALRGSRRLIGHGTRFGTQLLQIRDQPVRDQARADHQRHMVLRRGGIFR